MMLDKMIDITFDDEKMQVTAQGGCHLGEDPADPTKSSTVENSLLYQVDQRGWAIPSTGGIIHQTVSGFLSTGSSGGSMTYSISDHIVAIRLIDGNGKTHELSEASYRDKFYAAGVSMGLLGIITAVTFQCMPKFHLIGHEETTKIADSKVDLFGTGTADKPDLQSFLENTEYARLLWWPQKGVEKVTVWQGRPMQPRDYTAQTGSPENFRPKPYEQFPVILFSGQLSQILSGIYYRLIKRWNSPGLLGKITRGFLKLTLAPIINLFASTVGKEGTQKFWDTWWKALPMDKSLSDKWLPFHFSELWIPISRTREVMNKLKEHYGNNGVWATAAYPCEIYVKKSSKFWMSPAYERDVVKINLFWFAKNKENPATTYFPQFWELLREFDVRFHWGKYFPDGPPVGPEFLRTRYPHWDDFMDIRAEMDPNQIFVTDYWRKHLAIEPQSKPGKTAPRTATARKSFLS